jgi:DNA-binding MarR family transcriptional regulator
MAQGRSTTASQADVAMRLHSAAIRLLRTVRVEDRRLGLSPARLSVLSILVFGGARTLTQLTDAEQVAAPTMTKLIAGLEQDGFVTRQPDPYDGRVWVIHATRKARLLLHKGREHRVELLLELLADTSSADWDHIRTAVSVLEHALRRRS